MKSVGIEPEKVSTNKWAMVVKSELQNCNTIVSFKMLDQYKRRTFISFHDMVA